MGKSSGLKVPPWAIVVIVGAVLLIGFGGDIGANIGNWSLGVTSPGTTTTTTGEGLAVDRAIQFNIVDKYGGGGVKAKVQIFGDDLATLETISYSTTSGIANTTKSYKTGTLLYLNVTGDVTSAENRWYTITVPTMSQADVDSQTYNKVDIDFFDYTAPTVSVRMSDGTSVSDGATIYGTSSNSSAPVITVTWFQGTDNDGYMTSYDPINKLNLNALLVAKVHTGDYSLLTVEGFPNSVEKGSAMYYVYEIPATELTKWKIGTTYALPGTGSFTFDMDLGSLTVNTTQVDLYIYYYADYNYFLAKGSWGPDSLSVISGAPHDINTRHT